MKDKGKDDSETGFYYHGGLNRAIGMASRQKWLLLRAASKGMEHEEG